MAFFRKPEEKRELDELEALKQEVLKAKMPASAEGYALKELQKLEKTP
ncbi:MAG: hypothetical protein H6Q51_2223, partial [Deltaproteobacteria bacterium]|nr:hypothetical protein [Deltaproteobacteria bacterium]